MKDANLGDESAVSRDDAALLHLVARHLAAVEDVAELRDILDLLMARLGASSALLTILNASPDEPLRFLVGDAEMAPILEDLVVRLRDSRQLTFASSPEYPQRDPDPSDQDRGVALAVPIQGQPGNLIGVLAVTHPRRDVLDGPHVALLTAVGYQMAAALRQARLSSEIRRRAYELFVLDEIGQAFSSLDLEQLLRLILERTSRTLRVNRSVLFMLDEEHQELILKAVDHPGASGEVLGLRIPLTDRPHVADAIRTRQPVEVQNIYADPRWRDFWLRARAMGLQAALAVPLVAKGRAIGAISLDRTTARPPFAPNEIALGQIIANQAASAIENARLYGETRRYAYEMRLRMAELDQHVQRLALLNRISTTLVKSLKIAEIASTITVEIARILNVSQSALFVLGPDGVTGRVLACYPSMARPGRLPVEITLSDPSSVGPLRRADSPLLVRDVHASALLKPALPLLEARGIKSILLVPMAVAGQLQGVIGLDVTARSAPLSPGDMELAMTIGNQVASVLANAQLYTAAEQRAAENARLYQEAQRRADQLRLINEVSEEIGSILDIDLLLWSVVRLIREALDCYHVAIGLIEGDELVFKANVGYLYEYEDTRLVNVRLRITEEEGVAGWVARHGKPLLVPDVRQEPRYTTSLGFDGTRSEVAVPLKLGDRIIGVLDAHGSRYNGFDDSDLALLQSLATQIAVTVENARLFGVAHGERARLEAIIDGAEEVVLATDEEGRVVLMNRAAERAFHVTAVEALGSPLLDVVDNLEVRKLWRDSLQADSFPVVGEIALDDERTLYASIASVRRVGLVAVMQDVSHLKELDRMKSDFVSTVSHDLRSPLQAVRINLEVLPMMGPLNQEQREGVDSSLRVLERITNLVRDLLDLGHIEADVGLERAPCSMSEIIVTTVQDVQPRVRVLNLRLEAHVPQDLPDVYGDTSRLAQVVANLVDNAIKYTPTGGLIQVGARQSDGEVVVEVRDDGPGIAPEHRARLFEKFYRIPNVQHQKVEGTGLGLAIVKSIVEAHDGRIWVESSIEPETHGSTFGFAIPVAVTAEG